MHASILVQLSSFVHHFSSSSSSSLFLVSPFRPYRSQKRKEAIIFIAVVLSLSLSLSQPKILPASVYTHIYQSEEVRVLARRFFLLVLAKFGPDITTPDSSIRGCICLRTRIERAYIQKGIISGIYIYVCIYIYKSDVQF
jgi:hypothetical protein